MNLCEAAHPEETMSLPCC